jgi:hypothetical protein
VASHVKELWRHSGGLVQCGETSATVGDDCFDVWVETSSFNVKRYAGEISYVAC